MSIEATMDQAPHGQAPSGQTQRSQVPNTGLGAGAVQRRGLVAAELGLLVLALGVVTSFNRVFVGWSWWLTAAVPTAVAWAVSVLTRRRRVSTPACVLAHVLAAVLVLGQVLLRDSLRWGLPTRSTAALAVEQVISAFSPFRQLVAPVPAETGFLLVIAAGMWTLVVFADIAAIRFRSPGHATVPYLTTFVALGFLAGSTGQITAMVVMSLSLAAYATTQMALDASRMRWVGGRAADGTRAMTAATLAVALVAAAGATFGAGLLPGGDDAVIDLRGYARREESKTLVSPFVSLRSLLGERSDQVMFRVQAPDPAYWRLTALDRYDEERDIWVSRGSYRPVDGALDPGRGPDVGSSSMVQLFEIDALATGWLPAAYAPAEIRSDSEIRYDEDSASLLGNAEPSTDDPIRYVVRSEMPDFATAMERADVESAVQQDPELRKAVRLAPPVQDALDDAFAFAREVDGVDTTGATTRLRVLQDWFRSDFSYDDSVDFSDSADPLAAFIEARRGFCQQFSSAFALIARSMGYATRVAVGFTPGDATAGPDGTVEYVVRGRHAHAWPEVHLGSAGWVPFEPTPQRGDPRGEDHTGVEPAQAAPPAPTTTTTVASTDGSPDSAPESTAPTTSPTSNLDDSPAQIEPEPPVDEVDRRDETRSGLIAAVAVMTAAAVAGLLAVARRRSRRKQSSAPDQQVAGSWKAALADLARTGRRPAEGDTPLEFARRVDHELGDVLVPLATIETRRRFDQGATSSDEAAQARILARGLSESLSSAGLRTRRRVDAAGPWPWTRRR